ncbi:MAG: hypothetical protein M0C28_32970 [Candidatus Moduliflexus flocculans]|nr:hypothetical protein [Candidatus Moduliflexus flocculans]
MGRSSGGRRSRSTRSRRPTTTCRPSSNTWWGSEMSVKRSFGRVFGFFFGLGRKTGKTRAFALLGLCPGHAGRRRPRSSCAAGPGDMAGRVHRDPDGLLPPALCRHPVPLLRHLGRGRGGREPDACSYLTTRPVSEAGHPPRQIRRLTRSSCSLMVADRPRRCPSSS